jgi:FtsP/CotA-like multicopper oxidase with cupredoxin domain
LFDFAKISAHIGKDTGEIWILQAGGGWLHPVHIHMEEHRTLLRDNVRPGPQHLSYGRGDTMLLAGEERAVLSMKFRDWKGSYVMHCHNLVHEDHSMMIRWDVE